MSDYRLSFVSFGKLSFLDLVKENKEMLEYFLKGITSPKTSNQTRRLKGGCSVECSALGNVNTETDIEPSSRPPFPTSKTSNQNSKVEINGEALRSTTRNK